METEGTPLLLPVQSHPMRWSIKQRLCPMIVFLCLFHNSARNDMEERCALVDLAGLTLLSADGNR